MNRINLTMLSLAAIILVACDSSPVRKEIRPQVEAINKKIHLIDGNHRVRIVEDDYLQGDSIYKIRAYYMEEDALVKMVSILRTPHYERDDYFYFDDGQIMFSGHLLNERDAHLASEFKYYYESGQIFESLFWEDTYTPGQRFPHEEFKEFEPDLDSLIEMERLRITFFMEKLAMEGTEILHYNEYLEAN